ncbi:hypothetical protein GGX14DRAFT_598023, partial [Mycena pura]
RDDRYYNTPRARTPGADQSGVFFQGQGGRPLLPPLSSAFPSSQFPGLCTVPNQYSQHRRPGGYDYNQSYNNQWQPNNAPIAPQPAFPHYYDDGRYAAQPGYSNAMYVPRPATVAPGHGHHQSDVRKLPPLSTTPTPGRDDRWAAPYPGGGFNGAPNSNHIRSPTASYPTSYTQATGYPSTSGYGYDPRGMAALGPQVMPHDPRAGSPFGRNPHGHVPHPSPPTPPPISPISGDEPAVKKKRKRADAGQLRVLNETYARTAFPSTEERLALAKMLDMSPRSVQIWFQNKRQSMRQTNRQSSTPHQSFSVASEEFLDELEPTSQMPQSSHRRMRSEEVMDPRKYSRGY